MMVRYSILLVGVGSFFAIALWVIPERWGRLEAERILESAPGIGRHAPQDAVSRRIRAVTALEEHAADHQPERQRGALVAEVREAVEAQHHVEDFPAEAVAADVEAGEVRVDALALGLADHGRREVDGQDTPLITQYVMKFYEVQKYITKIRYVFLLEPLVISEQLFQRQSPEIQQVLLRAGKEAQEFCRQFLILFEDSIENELKGKGLEIMDPADGEKEWIEKATQTVWPKFYKSIGGKEKVDAALKAINREFPF